MTNDIKHVEPEQLPVELDDFEKLPLVPKGNYKLTDAQKRAAQAVVSNDMYPKGKRMTMSELSESIGVPKRTLFDWRQLPEFQRFKNDCVTIALNDFQMVVVSRLMESIDTSQPSIRAINTYLEMVGRLKNKQEITVNVPQATNDLRHVSNDELDDIIGEYVNEEE